MTDSNPPDPPTHILAHTPQAGLLPVDENHPGSGLPGIDRHLGGMLRHPGMVDDSRREYAHAEEVAQRQQQQQLQLQAHYQSMHLAAQALAQPQHYALRGGGGGYTNLGEGHGGFGAAMQQHLMATTWQNVGVQQQQYSSYQQLQGNAFPYQQQQQQLTYGNQGLQATDFSQDSYLQPQTNSAVPSFMTSSSPVLPGSVGPAEMLCRSPDQYHQQFQAQQLAHQQQQQLLALAMVVKQQKEQQHQQQLSSPPMRRGGGGVGFGFTPSPTGGTAGLGSEEGGGVKGIGPEKGPPMPSPYNQPPHYLQPQQLQQRQHCEDQEDQQQRQQPQQSQLQHEASGDAQMGMVAPASAGKPSLHASLPPPSFPPKRPRGRPRKPPPLFPLPKRPRGRPRKSSISFLGFPPFSSPAPKKPRGRPRKSSNPAPPVGFPPFLNGRGQVVFTPIGPLPTPGAFEEGKDDLQHRQQQQYHHHQQQQQQQQWEEEEENGAKKEDRPYHPFPRCLPCGQQGPLPLPFLASSGDSIPHSAVSSFSPVAAAQATAAAAAAARAGETSPWPCPWSVASLPSLPEPFANEHNNYKPTSSRPSSSFSSSPSFSAVPSAFSPLLSPPPPPPSHFSSFFSHFRFPPVPVPAALSPPATTAAEVRVMGKRKYCSNTISNGQEQHEHLEHQLQYHQQHQQHQNQHQQHQQQMKKAEFDDDELSVPLAPPPSALATTLIRQTSSAPSHLVPLDRQEGGAATASTFVAAPSSRPLPASLLLPSFSSPFYPHLVPPPQPPGKLQTNDSSSNSSSSSSSSATTAATVTTTTPATSASSSSSPPPPPTPLSLSSTKEACSRSSSSSSSLSSPPSSFGPSSLSSPHSSTATTACAFPLASPAAGVTKMSKRLRAEFDLWLSINRPSLTPDSREHYLKIVGKTVKTHALSHLKATKKQFARLKCKEDVYNFLLSDPQRITHARTMVQELPSYSAATSWNHFMHFVGLGCEEEGGREEGRREGVEAKRERQ